MISSITGFERLVISYEKEITRLRALLQDQAEQIDSLQKTVEALATACEQNSKEPSPAFKNLIDDKWAGIV